MGRINQRSPGTPTLPESTRPRRARGRGDNTGAGVTGILRPLPPLIYTKEKNSNNVDGLVGQPIEAYLGGVHEPIRLDCVRYSKRRGSTHH